jgi:hypothetical protein
VALDVFFVLNWFVLTGVDHYHIFTDYFLLHRILSFLTLHVLYFVSRWIQDQVIDMVLFFGRIQETVQGMVIHALKVQSNRRKEFFFLYLSEQIVRSIIVFISAWLFDRSRLDFKVKWYTFWNFTGGKHLLWSQKHLLLPRSRRIFRAEQSLSDIQRCIPESKSFC